MKKLALILVSLLLLVGCAKVPVSSSSSSIASTSSSSTQSSSSVASESVSYSSIVGSTKSSSADFIAGPKGTKTETLKIGDVYLGMTVKELIVNEYDDIDAFFVGDVELTGSLSYHGAPLEGQRIMISFSVDESDTAKLPYYKSDTRTVWFTFDNEQEVLDALSIDANETVENIKCKVVISDYRIIFYPTDIANLATMKSIEKL